MQHKVKIIYFSSEDIDQKSGSQGIAKMFKWNKLYKFYGISMLKDKRICQLVEEIFVNIEED